MIPEENSLKIEHSSLWKKILDYSMDWRSANFNGSQFDKKSPYHRIYDGGGWVKSKAVDDFFLALAESLDAEQE